MKIRRFIKQDLPQVLDLCREVRQYHIDILDGYFTEQNDFLEQQGFLDSLNGDKMIAFVAEDNDVILGYLLAERKSALHLIYKNYVNVANFGVAANKRGQGVGKKLMDALFEMCQKENVDEIRLGVYNKNIRSCQFYEHYGFKPIEQRMHLLLNKK